MLKFRYSSRHSLLRTGRLPVGNRTLCHAAAPAEKVRIFNSVEFAYRIIGNIKLP